MKMGHLSWIADTRPASKHKAMSYQRIQERSPGWKRRSAGACDEACGYGDDGGIGHLQELRLADCGWPSLREAKLRLEERVSGGARARAEGGGWEWNGSKLRRPGCAAAQGAEQFPRARQPDHEERLDTGLQCSGSGAGSGVIVAQEVTARAPKDPDWAVCWSLGGRYRSHDLLSGVPCYSGRCGLLSSGQSGYAAPKDIDAYVATGTKPG